MAHRRILPATAALSDAPMTAAAFLLPFLTIVSIFLMMQSAQIEIPRFWAYIPFSLVLGCLEIVSGAFLSERVHQSTTMAEIRRHIIASAIILGISFLIAGKDDFLFIPIACIYVIQWLVTGKIRKMSSSLVILEQYAGNYTGTKLAQRMRDTMEEAQEFYQTTEQIHIITLLFLIIQFGFAFISLLLGYPLSWGVLIVLVLSAAVHFLLRYFIRHLSESQNLLHEGLRVSERINRYRTVMALVIIAVSLIIALLISPGWSLFPPGTLIAWLSSLFKESPTPIDMLEIMSMPSPEPSGMAKMLQNLPDQTPLFRLDILFRVLGIAGLIVIIFFIIKPFFLPAFYRSVKGFHPLKRLLSAIKRFFDGLIGITREFSQFMKEFFTGPADQQKAQMEAWGLSGSLLGKNVSRKKRQEWSKVVRALLSLTAAAESLGIRYRKFEGPGTFIARIQLEKIEDHNDSVLCKNILMQLNSVFYSPAPLPGNELKELLQNMKKLSKKLVSLE